ncbi:MAG: 4a-hydroxytetrahydrobiopterin dehydratase [Gallionella sp.]|nr:4a-hydroxytetrahydrobiopterin dehydratase [Gallionella sp.]
MNTACDLSSRRCTPCEGGTPALPQPEVDRLIQNLNGWMQYDHLLSKTYRFNDYCQTIAFVNAIAWMAHRENHHPELRISYNSCQVEYTTHAIHGLSENDFICAAKVDALFQS